METYYPIAVGLKKLIKLFTGLSGYCEVSDTVYLHTTSMWILFEKGFYTSFLVELNKVSFFRIL